MARLNDAGVKRLKEFLINFHRNGQEIVTNDYMLIHWINEIENNAAKGNLPIVSIQPWNKRIVHDDSEVYFKANENEISK